MASIDSERPESVDEKSCPKENKVDYCVQCNEETRKIIENSVTNISWVSCETCDEWIHSICSKLREEEVSETNFYCIKCSTTESNPPKNSKKSKNSQKQNREGKVKSTTTNVMPNQQQNENPDLSQISNHEGPPSSKIQKTNSSNKLKTSSSDITPTTNEKIIPSSNENTQSNGDDDNDEIIPNSQITTTHDPGLNKCNDLTNSYDVKKNTKDDEVSEKAKALESRTKAVILKEYRKLEKKVKEREQKLTEKDSVIEKLNNEILLGKAQNARSEKTITQLTEMTNSEETEKIRNLLEQLQASEKKLADTNQKNIELKKVNTEKQAEIRKLKEQINKIEEKLNTERSNLEKEVKERTAQNKLLELTEQSKSAQIEKMNRLEKLVKDKDNMLSENYKIITKNKSTISKLQDELKTLGNLQYNKIDPTCIERREVESSLQEEESDFNINDKVKEKPPQDGSLMRLADDTTDKPVNVENQDDTIHRLVNDTIDITYELDKGENTLQRLVNNPIDISWMNTNHQNNDDTLQRLVNDSFDIVQTLKNQQEYNRNETSNLQNLLTESIPMPPDDTDIYTEGSFKYTDQPSCYVFSGKTIQMNTKDKVNENTTKNSERKTPCRINRQDESRKQTNTDHAYPLSPDIRVINHYPRDKSKSQTPISRRRESYRHSRRDDEQYMRRYSRNPKPRNQSKHHSYERYHKQDDRIPRYRNSSRRHGRSRYDEERSKTRYRQSYRESRKYYKSPQRQRNRQRSEERKDRQSRYDENYYHKTSEYNKPYTHHKRKTTERNERDRDRSNNKNYTSRYENHNKPSHDKYHEENQHDNDTTIELIQQFKQLIAPLSPYEKVNKETPVCRYYLQKRCIFGSRCRNKHVREESTYENEKCTTYADKTRVSRRGL